MCEAINKRIGHRGRVKDQEGGGTEREEGRVRGEERRSDTGRQREEEK